jgi:hypothetical protein
MLRFMGHTGRRPSEGLPDVIGYRFPPQSAGEAQTSGSVNEDVHGAHATW